ncbi:bifunctional DNA primase/polymerase [Gordonia sp. N1V]|uniref:bifunctional DNA primase/polymerase n=1 Tax=Gordonia sp. N1V TaxID=3034163 RepID=UPI0023E150DE|nr:bifunctional DNA primase/polymerase [Gordonia sp. N1V]MDF3280883.1 bifunctional DNA primase/polymerase [Gordonia sp. N1V]
MPDSLGRVMGYADVADLYWSLNWRGCMPVTRPGKKWPPPDGFTGGTAPMPSYADVDQWKAMYPSGHNTLLRVPVEVVGIDVDAYGTKRGGATFDEAQNRWGVLPHTVISTSRDDMVSGIRFYRMPPGMSARRSIIRFDEHLGDIEIVRHGHRYAIVYPSIHPETGGAYRWLDSETWTETAIPAPTELPELPPIWADALAEGSDTEVGSVDVKAALGNLTTGPMEPVVEEKLRESVNDLTEHPSSRFDTTRDNVLKLMRLSEQRYSGVVAALDALRKVYVVAVRDSRPANEAHAEFDRMITNPRGHALIAATPSVDVSVVEAAAETIAAELEEAGVDAGAFRADVESAVAEPEPAISVVVDDEPADPVEARTAELVDLEAGFWNARPVLTDIYLAALARMTSPWAVLGVCLARALAQVPPWITLPPLIGGRGSLNLFVALVGPSGGGKGAAEGAAADLLPLPDLKIAPAGSGEGLVHQYAHMERRELVRDHNSVLFSVPEVDTLIAVGARTGSTILSKLRNAYSGEDISFSYADPTRRIGLGSHSYRMTMVLGVQPGRARPLLDDADGGTPQRFLWMPATDPRISRDRPPLPSPVYVPEEAEWGGQARSISIPDVAADTILDARVTRMQGHDGALDGHALFTREKVMVALAALDGRTTVRSDDWELSEIVMGISDFERAKVAALLADEFEREATEKGRSQGIARVAADDVVWDRRLQRAIKFAARKLSKADGPVEVVVIKRSARSDLRDQIEDAVAHLAATSMVELDRETGTAKWKV